MHEEVARVQQEVVLDRGLFWLVGCWEEHDLCVCMDGWLMGVHTCVNAHICKCMRACSPLVGRMHAVISIDRRKTTLSFHPNPHPPTKCERSWCRRSTTSKSMSHARVYAPSIAAASAALPAAYRSRGNAEAQELLVSSVSGTEEEGEGEGTACPHSRMTCRYFPVVSTCAACSAKGGKTCSGRRVELFWMVGRIGWLIGC